MNFFIYLFRFVALFALFAFYAGTSFAESDMDKFYKIKLNADAFEKAKKAGEINKGREVMVTACKKAKNSKSKSKADCDCVKKVVDNTTDKEFFYESMLSIKIYKETMDALRSRDMKRVESIKARQAKRTGFPKMLAEKCGME